MKTCAYEKSVVESNVNHDEVAELLESELASVGGGMGEPAYN